MDITEVTRITTFVSQVKPAQKIDEFTPDAWLLALHDLPYGQAMEGARRVAMRETWIDPAAIRAEVRSMRRDAAGRADPHAMIPNADPDDVPAYLRAVRDGNLRAAAGLVARPVHAALEGAFRSPGGRS